MSTPASTRTKNRTVPLRLLAVLLYGRHPWMSRMLADDGLSIRVRSLVGPLRRALGVTTRSRTREYVAWLEARGLVSDVVVDAKGRLECRIPTAAHWNEWSFPGWELKECALPGVSSPAYSRLLRDAAETLTQRATPAGELVG